MSEMPSGCITKGCDADWFAYSAMACEPEGPTETPELVVNETNVDVCLGGAVFLTLTVTGSTLDWTFAVASGALPAGVVLTKVDGTHATVTGNPAASGSYSFAISATSGWGVVGTVSYTVLVVEVTTPAGALPGYTVGTPYSEQLTVTGGTGSYSWAIGSGSLPPGLTLDSAGLISGTATQGGDWSLEATVDDGQVICGVDLTLHGTTPPPPPPLTPGERVIPDLECEQPWGDFRMTVPYEWVDPGNPANKAEIGCGGIAPWAEMDPAIIAAWAAALAGIWASAPENTGQSASMYWKDVGTGGGTPRFNATHVFQSPPLYDTDLSYNWVLAIGYCLS